MFLGFCLRGYLYFQHFSVCLQKKQALLKHFSTHIYEAFKDLSKREKEILMLRYGLMNYDELTQKDVAKMMGISQSYISRLEKKIIKKLRNKLNYNEIK